MRFAGKRALVTGGGSGIGRATARALANEGAVVVVADVDPSGAGAAVVGAAVVAPTGGVPAVSGAGVIAPIGGVSAVSGAGVAALTGGVPAVSGAGLVALTVDVSDAVQVERAMDAAGPLDVVVHCAGVDDPVAKQRIAECAAAGQPLDVALTLTDERWRRQLSVNLDGTFHVLRAALRVMVPRGRGAIVVIGSSAALDAPPGYGHYAAAKAGVHALCQSVAKEVVDRGIRVNVVAPGPTDTGMAARTPPALRASNAGVGRYASPEEIAEVALFLASDAAANLAGAVLLANGGRFTR